MIITGYAVLFDQPDKAGHCFSRKMTIGGIKEVPVHICHWCQLPAIGRAFLKKTRYGIKYRAFITDPEYIEILKKHAVDFTIEALFYSVDDFINVFDLEVSFIAERFSTWDRDKLRIKVQ